MLRLTDDGIFPRPHYGNAIVASGGLGFHGEGYPYHKYLKKMLSGFDMSGMTLTSKTLTLRKRLGNAPTQNDDGVTLMEFKPACIDFDFFDANAINAFGLTNPGIDAYLEKTNEIVTSSFQTKNFFISISVLGTHEEQLFQAKEIVSKIYDYDSCWRHKSFSFGLQLNISCPNSGDKVDANISHIHELLTTLSSLGRPIMVKINALMSVENVMKIAAHQACAGIVTSNTFGWDEIPALERIDLFGSTVSPLAKRWGKTYRGKQIFTVPNPEENAKGGVSGKYLFPFVVKQVQDLRKAGFEKPIIAGGGILHPDNVDILFEAGAQAISPGSVIFLRPWRVKSIIERAIIIGGKYK